LLESPNTDYTAHILSPLVFSTAIAMMVTTAIITMYLLVKPSLISLAKNWHVNNIMTADGGAHIYAQRYNIMSRITSNLRHFLLIAVITCLTLLLVIFPGVPVWIAPPAILIAIIFMIVETRGRAELGMGVGMSSFVILLIVGLAFDKIIPLLVLEGCVVAIVITFSLVFQIFKQSEFCNVDTKGMTTMAFIGVVTGSIVCVPFMKFFNSLYGIGSTSLPAPFSVIWLEMANTTVAKVMSPSINLYMILLGIGLALVMYRYKVSAVTVAIGLLSVSTSIMIIIGGIIAWTINKKGYMTTDNGVTASGIMIGDIIVSILTSLVHLI